MNHEEWIMVEEWKNRRAQKGELFRRGGEYEYCLLYPTILESEASSSAGYVLLLIIIIISFFLLICFIK